MRSASAAIGRPVSTGALGSRAARASRRAADSARACSNRPRRSSSSGDSRQRDHSPISRPRSRLSAVSIAPRPRASSGGTGPPLRPRRRDGALSWRGVGFIAGNCRRGRPRRTHDMATATKARRTARGAKATKGRGVRPRPAAAPGNDSRAPQLDIGIEDGDRKEISTGLSAFLADAYTLYLKTHNFHWNVTGPMFNALHAMFEEQYTEQWEA